MTHDSQIMQIKPAKLHSYSYLTAVHGHSDFVAVIRCQDVVRRQ